jgi:hypothetical protein
MLGKTEGRLKAVEGEMLAAAGSAHSSSEITSTVAAPLLKRGDRVGEDGAVLIELKQRPAGAGKARVWGLEVEAKLKPAKPLSQSSTSTMDGIVAS